MSSYNWRGNLGYNQIVENHPGIHNEKDPHFKESLEHSYALAQASLSETSGPKQDKRVIEDFINSFKDSHLGVHWNEKSPENRNTQQIQHFSLQYTTPEIIWISLPTFELDSDQEKEFRFLLQEIPNFRQNHVVVFDLRGNQGGNSGYGSKIVDALFTQDFAQQQREEANKNVFVDWRASADNLSYLQSIYKRAHFEWLKPIVEGITLSLKEQKPYYKEINVPPPHRHVSGLFLNLVTSKVVVIMDDHNMSAALDFIDELKMMDSVMLVGKTTKADRVYMEARNVNLPSGLGTFTFPIKVYRNRVRGDNKPYKPDIECDTNDTSKLEKLVQHEIEF
jgi:hypothetical protein